ncbi:MAG: ATP synthase F0 subunit B, partial [Actinobacteria bacterium]|nr:ATP synthase F0 subunit B [Actinomycetota bacterium]
MKDDSDKAREALQRAAKHAKAFDIRSEAILHDVLYVLHNAHQAMFSSYVKIDRDELTELIEEAIDALPKELAEARNMIEERDSFLAQREREAQEILDDVRAQAERMVQRSEIVREARRSAQRIVDEANSEANSMRRAVDEYCDKRLAAFEISLDRILRSVREGREKMVSSTMGTDFPKASSTARTDNSSGDKRFVESSMSSR